MKLFNFEVYAVMATEYDSEGEPETPELLGFFSTRIDANMFARLYESDRISRFEAHSQHWNRMFGSRNEPSPNRFDYTVLSIADVLVDGRWPLNSLEEKLVMMATGTAAQ